MISYEGLNKILVEKGIGKSELGEKAGLSSRTIAKIKKGEKLSRQSIRKIADWLGSDPDLLMKEVPDSRLLRLLREEKDIRMPGGLYHELQVRMTYNSNHMEGSRLSEDQTRMIFETNVIGEGNGLTVDDVLETVHHFRAIDYVIDTAEEELSEGIIKELHYILKHDTRDADLSWFAVGDYKRRANMIGGKETSKPSEVQGHMEALLERYNARKDIQIEDIIEFHAEFEYIHPFQDGNGRVGRLIALKECLRHDITPFIIEETKKNYYYRGLAQWKDERGWLIDTCLDGQDTFTRLMEMLDIP